MAASISVPADSNGCPTASEAHVEAGVTLAALGGEITRQIRLSGPGDIVALSDGQVVRSDPPPGGRDVPPNYFPYVELRDAALPWAYTPAAANNANGRLMPWLVLVVLAEDDDVALTLGGGDLAPWRVSIASDAGKRLPALQEAYAWAHVQDYSQSTDPAAAYAARPADFVARLSCPVRMTRGQAYVACLVPAFEAGRLAGLGRDMAGVGAQLAWEEGTGSLDLPVYHHWRFTTGNADFETLVRRLMPFEAGPSIGVHDLDLSRAGAGLDSETLGVREKHAMVSFAGALMSPIAAPRDWAKPHRQVFQPALEAMLATPARRVPKSAGFNALEDDPLVAPPLYGRWQSEQDSLKGAPNWMSQANQDPRNRVAAGLGAEVVRRNQEALMAEAWSQAAAAKEAGDVLRHARLALAVGTRVHARVARLPEPSVMQLTTPIQTQIPTTEPGSASVAEVLDASAAVPAAALSPAMRRATVAAAPVAARGQRGIARLQDRATTLCLSGGAVALEAALFAPDLNVSTMTDINLSGAPVAATISFARLREISGVSGARVVQPVTLQPRVATRVFASKSAPNIAALSSRVLAATEPKQVLPPRIGRRVKGLPAPSTNAVPIRRAAAIELRFGVATYRKLQQISEELLLPGFGDLPDNSVSMMVTNGTFIASYLLGLNHEMSRELAWRQFPSRLNGTWFRRFWDRTDSDDIKDISGWGKRKSLLNCLLDEGEAGQSVVLIKGALMRLYPDTRVYAQRAKWGKNKDAEVLSRLKGGIEKRARVPDPKAPDPVRHPVFEGRIGTSASFFGFELDPDDMVGKEGDAGWFIVFEQPRTKPHFGLDSANGFSPDTAPKYANDLHWGHFADSEAALAALSHATAHPAWADTEIEGAYWGRNSADTAALAWQRPVRILFHASGLIGEGGQP